MIHFIEELETSQLPTSDVQFLRFERVNLSAVRPNPRDNGVRKRRGNKVLRAEFDHRVATLAEAIRESRKVVALPVYDEGGRWRLLDGHHRLAALKLLRVNDALVSVWYAGEGPA